MKVSNYKPDSEQIVDFHLHSNASLDGVKTVKRLVKEEADRDVSMIAVTDHNTLKGVNGFLDKFGTERQRVMERVSERLILFPGVEVTAKIKDIPNVKGNPVKVHLMVYGVDRSDNSPISRVLRVKRKNDENVDLGFLYQLQKFFKFNIPQQDVIDFIKHMKKTDAGFQSFGKTETFNFVKFSKYDLTKTDQELFDIIDNFHITERLNLEVEDVINLVHASGGIVTLAHPYANLKRTARSADVIKYLIAHEIDGFELYYPLNTTSCDVFMRNACQENGVQIITGGSDYHHGRYDQSMGSHFIPYQKITVEKVSAFIDYMVDLEYKRQKGSLIVKDYENLKDFDIEKTIKKYEREFCIIEDLKLKNFNSDDLI